MSTEIHTLPSGRPDILRQRIIVGAIAAILLGGWMYLTNGPLVLAVTSFLGAIMATELFLMFAPGRYLYAVGIALLTAMAIWFSGRDSIEVTFVLMPVIFVIGWIVAPPSWRVVFPVYVVILTASSLTVFLLRETGVVFSLWPAFVAMLAGIGTYAGRRWLGDGLTGGVAGAVVLAAGGGLVAAPLLEPAHGVVFWIAASIILALGAMASTAVERSVKQRAGVVWASDILPGYGGFLDMFRGMIFTYLLTGLGVLAGLI